jgi:hypothetical protein
LVGFRQKGRGRRGAASPLPPQGEGGEAAGLQRREEAGWLKSPYFFFILYHIYLLLCSNHKGRNKLKKKIQMERGKENIWCHDLY